jgi:hypothetical protein
MLERDSGVELSRATLDGWVLKVGELPIPMTSAMRQELLRGTYIQADETPVDVQMQGAEGKTIKPICGSTADQEQRWCSISFGPGTGWTETVFGAV